MNPIKLRVTFIRDRSPATGAGYVVGDEAAFNLEDAVWLVGKEFAVFSDPSDLDIHRAAVEKAKLSRPAPWVHPMVKIDPRRWG